jgi:hypothetical protein
MKNTYGEDDLNTPAVPGVYEHGGKTVAPPGDRAALEWAGLLPLSLRRMRHPFQAVCLCGTGRMALPHQGLLLPAAPHTGRQLCCPRLAGVADRTVRSIPLAPSLSNVQVLSRAMPELSH